MFTLSPSSTWIFSATALGPRALSPRNVPVLDLDRYTPGSTSSSFSIQARAARNFSSAALPPILNLSWAPMTQPYTQAHLCLYPSIPIDGVLQPSPEPSTWLLLASGLAVLLFWTTCRRVPDQPPRRLIG